MTKRDKLRKAARNCGLPIVRAYVWAPYASGIYARCSIYSDKRAGAMVRVKFAQALRNMSGAQRKTLCEEVARQFMVPFSQVTTGGRRGADLFVLHHGPQWRALTYAPSVAYDQEQYAREIFKLSPLGGRR